MRSDYFPLIIYNKYVLQNSEFTAIRLTKNIKKAISQMRTTKHPWLFGEKTKNFKS